MKQHCHWCIAAAAILAAVASCGTDSEPPPRFADVGPQSEAVAERRVDIADRQARLTEVEREIDRIEKQLESPALSIDEHASWSRQLFDLKHERLLLRSELNRAKIVSEKEWQAMQDSLETALEALEDEVSKLSDEVGAAVEQEGQPSTRLDLREEEDSRDG